MSKIEFKRGDTVTHSFVIPTSSWSAGGKLFFTAKPAVDDDLTDASAVINKSFDDTVTANDGTNVTYTCLFVPADTNSISMAGLTKQDYKAEFQFVSASGVVSTFPGNDKFLDAVVYADLRRATT
jgi:hypothetical protein